jgi:hypothetical protein
MFQADVSVTPPGGQSYFYSGARDTLASCGPPATIAGDIDLCTAAGSAGSPTSTEVGGGTLTASGPQALASQSNPVAPLPVVTGNYTMEADSPTGYVFVSCGGSATIASNGVTASESVVVPAGGAGHGIFYVVAAAPAGTLNGGSPPATVSTDGPATKPGTPDPGGTLAQQTLPSSSSPTQVGSSHLAFTGANTLPLLISGLMALSFGALATTMARARRRARRRPAHARR